MDEEVRQREDETRLGAAASTHPAAPVEQLVEDAE